MHDILNIFIGKNQNEKIWRNLTIIVAVLGLIAIFANTNFAKNTIRSAIAHYGYGYAYQTPLSTYPTVHNYGY